MSFACQTGNSSARLSGEGIKVRGWAATLTLTLSREGRGEVN
jgi:hypothetical protein